MAKKDKDKNIKQEEVKNNEEIKEDKTNEMNEEEIRKVLEDYKVIQDKYTRLQAEFVNYQNRTKQEISNMFKYEGESLIKELLETIDDFERAIMMDDNDLSDEVSLFLKGVKMIYTRFVGILDKLEVKPIDVEGREFDPQVAEAVLTEHDESRPENVVLEVLKKGYMYKDKLIRPAMVKVNK